MGNKKKWIFLVYAALVLLIPTFIIGSSENILSNGKMYKFRMQGRDPFDFFRGNYLTVRLDTRGIATKKSDWKAGEKVFLSIALDEDGFAYFQEALPTPPKKGDYMETRVVKWWSVNAGFGAFFGEGGRRRRVVDVEMPNNLGKYFINEEYALSGQNALRSMRGETTVGVRVKNGHVRLQDIYIEGKPIMRYLETTSSAPIEESFFPNF